MKLIKIVNYTNLNIFFYTSLILSNLLVFKCYADCGEGEGICDDQVPNPTLLELAPTLLKFALIFAAITSIIYFTVRFFRKRQENKENKQ